MNFGIILQAVNTCSKLYNKNGRIDPNWMELIWFNKCINFTHRKTWELKELYWISHMFDSQWNLLSREQIQAFFHIAIHFPDHENLRILFTEIQF